MAEGGRETFSEVDDAIPSSSSSSSSSHSPRSTTSTTRELVDQNFTIENSLVIVDSGDHIAQQHNTNITVHGQLAPEQVSDQTKKQRILTRSINSQLKEQTRWDGDKHVRMKLYTAIYESDDEDLIKNLSVIDTSHISLSRDEAHIVGSLAARNKSLDSIDLRNCSIDDEHLGIIARCLKDPIRAKELYLHHNNFSDTALRSLLGHDRIESLSGNLHWTVVKLDVKKWSFKLRNEEDAIKISEKVVAGRFNIEQSTLVFEECAFLAQAAYLAILFDAKLIKCPLNLYAKQDDLLELSKWRLEKMSKILLDCTEEKTIDWSAIETSFKKYQMEFLDIAVNGQTSDDDYERIVESGKKISDLDFPLNIHVTFFVGKSNDFKKIVEDCQAKKIKYIRCVFDKGCCVSHDEISSLVNGCNFKKVTLIYLDENETLKGEELKKVKKIANDVDAEFEVLKRFRGVEDAWKQLDRIFSDREREKQDQVKHVKHVC